MKLSTLLLSSAALVVAGSAYAADLPAKKGAPAAKAATGCSAFGAGFFQIPGGDTCIQFSGYMRSENSYTANTARGTAPYSLAGAYGLNVDARSNSEAGAIRGYLRNESGAMTRAYVQVAGFTAGAADGLLDIGLGGNQSGQQFGGSGIGMLTYSMGAVSVGATSARNNNDTSTMAASRPDLILKYSMAAGPVSVTVGAASHEVVGSTTGSAQGAAFIGKLTFDAGSAKVSGYAAYAQGANSYLGLSSVKDADASAGNLSTGTNYAAQVTMPVGAAGSVGVYAGRVSATQNATSTTSTQYALWYGHTVAKGLTVQPELLNTTTDGTTSNVAYLRIQRDF